MAAIRALDQLDPRVCREIRLDDLARAIGRAVVHDHPAQRPHGLAQHRFDRERDGALLVASRCHYDVGPLHPPFPSGARRSVSDMRRGTFFSSAAATLAATATGTGSASGAVGRRAGPLATRPGTVDRAM